MNFVSGRVGNLVAMDYNAAFLPPKILEFTVHA